MATLLSSAGYDVESVLTNVGSEAPRTTDWTRLDEDLPPSWLEKVVDHWSRGKRTTNHQVKRQRHAEHCKACSMQGFGDEQLEFMPSQTASDGTSAAKKPNHRVAVPDSRKTTGDEFRARCSITGMTCSACVVAITSALEEMPYVKAVSVSLITHSALVHFDGEANIQDIVDTIEDRGYEVSVESVEKTSNERAETQGSEVDRWKASYSVEGMTCSSCVRAITEAMQSLPWIVSADVNLISHSATLVLEGKDNLELAVSTIEDLGYDAALTEVVPVQSYDRSSQQAQRQLSIKVGGMYCPLCPGRIASGLEHLSQDITTKKQPSVEDPILLVSYSPDPPSLTVRSILSAIKEVDSALEPSVYHPPSVEERARQIHARVQRRLFYRLLLSVLVAIPTFIIGIVYMGLVPDNDSGRKYLMGEVQGVPRAEWALFVLSTPVYFLAADVFHRHTLQELRTMWRPGSPVTFAHRFYRFGSMNMLISFGTSVAYLASIAQLIVTATISRGTESGGTSSYFDSVVFLTMFLLVGRIIEAYSKAKTGDAVASLQNLRPAEALLVLEDENSSGNTYTQSVPADLIELSDLVRVPHGGSPPCDGVLVEGEAVFDESSLTGESKPVKKTPGDTIFSGTINKGGSSTIRVTGVSGKSMLDQIINVVREGQARRAPIERLADVLTSYFVPFITLIAIGTWLIWLGLGFSGRLPADYLDNEVGGWAFWSLQFAIAVFVIACPCGIGLATPTALFVGGGLAAKHGILAKGGGEAFQEASRLDVVVFDKTGTLTEGGDPKVTDHQFLLRNDDQCDEAHLIAALRDVECHSSHPLGRAITAFCEAKTATALSTREIEEISGRGMKATFTSETHEAEIIAGNEAFMQDHGIELDEKTSRTLDTWKAEAKSIVVVAINEHTDTMEKSTWKPALILAIADALRPESHSVVHALTKEGVQVWMISGDNPITAAAVGSMVGIPPANIIAGVLPQQKAEKIQHLQRSQGQSSNGRAIVAMVGDGINDSPALAAADIGIAVGSGSDVAVSSADFVLVNSNMTTILTLVTLSRTVLRRVKFNFAWALVYNLLALPIAAGVLYPVNSGGSHIRLDPAWASLAMALSSISVVCSSLLMRTPLPLVGFRAPK
ncbi:hypothetical protein B0A50_06802 [Salinomyces thailandicus]|uniref:HMA domain-containing protein n=1 Tax=Salinomyces thailandicus TaxID=706561 RepID=A0A4U0TR44_9PEZI|nr:hypothetical protein B0A50_06802 [Salinomyces thailandica]